MRGTMLRRAAAAAVLMLGTVAIATTASANGGPTNPWSGQHGAEWIGQCEGNAYHFVLNQHRSDPNGDFRLNGVPAYQVNRGTAHFNYVMDDANERPTATFNGNLAQGGLVISGCGTPPPPQEPDPCPFPGKEHLPIDDPDCVPGGVS